VISVNQGSSALSGLSGCRGSLPHQVTPDLAGSLGAFGIIDARLPTARVSEQLHCPSPAVKLRMAQK
jgi:hypothetical protein